MNPLSYPASPARRRSAFSHGVSGHVVAVNSTNAAHATAGSVQRRPRAPVQHEQAAEEHEHDEREMQRDESVGQQAVRHRSVGCCGVLLLRRGLLGPGGGALLVFFVGLVVADHGLYRAYSKHRTFLAADGDGNGRR